MRGLRSPLPVALVCLSMLGTARGGAASDAPRTEPVSHSNAPLWGAAVRGLQMGIDLCPSRYCLDDEAVTFAVLLRNVSDGPLNLAGRVDSPGTRFETRLGYSVHAEVLSSTGQPIPEPPLQKLEGPEFRPGTIATGEIITVTKSEELGYLDLRGLVPGPLLIRTALTVRESKEEGGWSGTLTAEAPFEMTTDRIAWGKPAGVVRAGILVRAMEYGKEGRFTLVVENLTDRPVTIVSSNGWEMVALSRDGGATGTIQGLAGGVGLDDSPSAIAPKRVALAHHSVSMPTLGRWSADLGLGAGAVFRIAARLPCRIDDGTAPRDADLATETEVAMTNAPWAPLPAPSPLTAAAEPWGDAVDGVQCRLVPHKTKWRTGELPTLELQIRNHSALDYTVVLSQQPHDLNVDGCPYTWSAGWRGTGSSVHPGEEIGGMLVSLAGQWQARLATESPGRFELRSLSPGPGTHTVRFALDLRHGHPKGGKVAGGNRTKVVRVLSNPVSIEVLAE
jgi:hypothetical protein